MANLLLAIQCVVKNSISDLLDSDQSINRIHQKGIPLEELVKDIFADSLEECEKNIRIRKHSQVFSYLGNQNNPPDFIIKNGDAIEVKQIKSFDLGIKLNSPYPKSKLKADDPMITAACRSVDGGNWKSKDSIYVIGVVKENKLKRLWLIVSDCLASDDQIYKSIRDRIIMGIETIRDIEFSNTKELDRSKNLNYLENNYLNISGMWGFSSPKNIYDYLNIDYNENANLQVIAIMTNEKYLSFPRSDIESMTKMATEITNLEIKNIQIKSPNNSDNLIDAKLITYQN